MGRSSHLGSQYHLAEQLPERLREKRSRKAASHGQHRGNNFNAGGRTSSHKENKWSSPYSAAPVASDDPWAKWRK